MDIQPTTQQPISDDQELAKVLAGVNQQVDEAASSSQSDDEEEAKSVSPADEPSVAAPSSSAGNDLDAIKQEALNDLRPLVDKLNVSPEEKFDTYLLLLRSTDDKALIAPAYEAAHGITDEARRAQALLDIIKEIDYLSGPQTSAAA